MTEVLRPKSSQAAPFRFRLRPRRGAFYRVQPQPAADKAFYEDFDLIYRTLLPNRSLSSLKLEAWE